MTLTIRPRRRDAGRSIVARLLGDERTRTETISEIQERAGDVQARLGESVTTLGEGLAAKTEDVGRALGERLDDMRERLPDKVRVDKLNLDKLDVDRLPRIRLERKPTTADRLRSGLGTGLLAAAAVSVGAALAFMFDPARGRARRAYARDRAAAAVRHSARSVQRSGRLVASNVAGLRERLAHTGETAEPLNDATLAHKVESVLFRDPAIEKGRINVNAEDGVVVLRGVAENQDQIRTLEMRTREIVGVEDVENLLHLPDTPAPAESPRFHAAAAAMTASPSIAGISTGIGGNGIGGREPEA
jgi:hypothetical protein